MATVKSIAAEAGVSSSVVSAVLHGSRHVRVGEATRQRVLAIVEQVGYVPNQTARALRLSRAGVLALVLPNPANPVYERLVEGVYDAADETGSVVFLGDAGRVTSGTLMLERIVGGGQVDGTLLRPGSLIQPEFVEQLQRTGPVVLMDCEWPTAPSLSLDDAAAARMATEHLLSHGHTTIAFFGGANRPMGNQRRVAGYRAALAEAGLQDAVIVSGMSARAARDGFQQLLQLDPRPTAVVVNNVTTAIGVSAAARAMGLHVPDDLAMVAIHDIPLAQDLEPSISAVALPLYELGARSVHLANRAVNGDAIDSGMLTDPAPVLHRRSSCCSPTPG